MDRYKEDDIVEGVVTGIEDYGIFVGLDNYYSGLIHISEISKDYVRNINNYVNIGETIKVKVLGVDDDNCHLRLSIKNIDYRINRKNRRFIEETGTGFQVLKNSLDKWIGEKNNEKN